MTINPKHMTLVLKIKRQLYPYGLWSVESPDYRYIERSVMADINECFGDHINSFQGDIIKTHIIMALRQSDTRSWELITRKMNEYDYPQH